MSFQNSLVLSIPLTFIISVSDSLGTIDSISSIDRSANGSLTDLVNNGEHAVQFNSSPRNDHPPPDETANQSFSIRRSSTLDRCRQIGQLIHRERDLSQTSDLKKTNDSRVNYGELAVLPGWNFQRHSNYFHAGLSDPTGKRSIGRTSL